MANEQRFYRHVGTIEDAHTAIKELTDHVYELRSRLDEHHEKLGKMQPSNVGQESATAKFNTQINGLFITGTPPTHGQTLKYNATTGQIEWT